jgi:hypothetical protein
MKSGDARLREHRGRRNARRSCVHHQRRPRSPECRLLYPLSRWALIARGTAHSNLFPVPSDCGLPHLGARSELTFVVSRHAQLTLAITPRRFAASPKATHLSRRLRPLRFLHRRSDSYRLERPRCRARISLAEDQHLQHGAHQVRQREAPGAKNQLPSLTPRSAVTPRSAESDTAKRRVSFPSHWFVACGTLEITVVLQIDSTLIIVSYLSRS